MKPLIIFTLIIIALFLWDYDRKHTVYVTYEDMARASYEGKLIPDVVVSQLPSGEGNWVKTISPSEFLNKLGELERTGRTVMWLGGHRWKFKVREAK